MEPLKATCLTIVMSLVARFTQLNYISSKLKTAMTIIETMTATGTMIVITVALEQKNFLLSINNINPV